MDDTLKESVGTLWRDIFQIRTSDSPDTSIQNQLAAWPRIGMPDVLKEKYDSMLKRTGRKLWRTILQVAASGFGKGVLLMAAAVTLGFAGYYGLVGYAGDLPGPALGLSSTLEQGIMHGIGQGLGFLGKGIGLLTLAIGGTLGAVNETRKTQNKLTAEIARAEAQEFALARQLGQVQQQQPEMEKGQKAAAEKPWNQPDGGFIAREQQRRAAVPAPGIGGGV